MKQLDYESCNYKHKEDIKTFVNSFNELADKYVKGFENSDADLKKVTSSIAKKTNSIEKLEATLLDLGNKTDELTALKTLSNDEIKALNEKKSAISYTDSEVQKMELDDINAQITAKKSKISKIDAKIDATKAKIKASNDEKKAGQKELRELEKNRMAEEDALFKTQSLIQLVKDLKDELNSRALDIVNAHYKPSGDETDDESSTTDAKIDVQPELRPITEEELTEPISEEIVIEDTDDILITGEIDLGELDYVNLTVGEMEEKVAQEEEVPVQDDDEDEGSDLVLGSAVSDEPVVEEKETDEEIVDFDALLKDKFEKEGLNVKDFTSIARDKMVANKDAVIQNMDILKKHGVPLEYTVDQPEIYYDITSQDLDDLLSIITTDDEGNGMGFTIDFTFNILTELSKINVDKLIDVYNNEFMNVNSKSGIIHLLKLTNPNLTEFEKNRRVNIEILRGLGANTVDEIIEKHPEFINMDNPLFVNVLNVFDKNDLVEKLNTDVEVVTKIIEYWKNN